MVKKKKNKKIKKKIIEKKIIKPTKTVEEKMQAPKNISGMKKIIIVGEDGKTEEHNQ